MTDELSRIKNRIKNNKDLPSQYLLTEYHNHLKRTGAQARGTQANYLKSIRKILLHHNQLRPEKLDQLNQGELTELNREVADNIQNSVYRSSEGVDGKRRKREYWTAWKKLLETSGVNTSKTKDYIPEIKFTETGETGKQKTRPEHLPNHSQVKKFLDNLEKKSRAHVALRNQALALLLWDKGPRIGEALNIKIKDVHVQGRQVKIRIPGNKGSEDRKVEVFQGRKTLKDWLQKHPYRENGESYLFPVLQKDNPENKLTRTNLAQKFHQAASDLDFKTSGEPFHIFRKGMVTSHIVNK